jgi:hypothetical protein
MKLTQILKEITINSPGRKILWGVDGDNEFTGLARIQGFSTTHDALKEINKLLISNGVQYQYFMGNNKPITGPMYVFLARSGWKDFAKTIPGLDMGFGLSTEEDWGVTNWVTSLPRDYFMDLTHDDDNDDVGLYEIKVNQPGRRVLWGVDDNNRFTELVKVQGFPTTQAALDEINRLLDLDDEVDQYYMDDQYNMPMKGLMYCHLSGDGDTSFTEDLYTFGLNYQTEEDWGVTKWTEQVPF